MISDTFGDKDKRNKIINVLKKNFKRNKTTKIISKKLYMNLINVEDINNAIDILLKKNIKSDNFVLKNKRNLLINDIIIKINKISKKKIKIKWLSNKIMIEKIYNYKNLKYWKPYKSGINDIINVIIK